MCFRDSECCEMVTCHRCNCEGENQGMDKQQFWILTHMKGLDSNSHTKLWNFYQNQDLSGRYIIVQTLNQFPDIRNKPLTKSSRPILPLFNTKNPDLGNEVSELFGEGR